MRAEHDGRPTEAEIEHLALTLAEVAGDQSVRVIEALAAALANRGRSGAGAPAGAHAGLAEAGAAWLGAPPASVPLCRRVARRAVRGSLQDPTGGATLFHRIDDSPPWARQLMPVAVFGQFLFYKE